MRRYSPRHLFVSLSLMMALVYGLVFAQPAAPQSTAQLEVHPASLTLDLGARRSVEVRLLASQDLASFEVDLAFDPTVVVVERVERVIGAPALPPPNRTWVSLPVSDDPSITFLDNGPGRIAFGAFSFGASNPPSANGDLTLVRLHLRAVGIGTSVLRPERVLITDSNAHASPVTTANGQVIVTGSAYSLFVPYLLKNFTLPTTR